MDWLLLSCIASAIIAIIIGLILIDDWLVNRRWERRPDKEIEEAEAEWEYQRIVRHGDQCPWNIK